MTAAPCDCLDSLDSSPIEWRIDVPLATNRVVLRQLALIIVIPAATLALLILVLGVIDNNPGEIKSAVILFFAAIAILTFLVAIAVLLVLGNRVHMKFRLGRDDITSNITDNRAKVSRRLAISLGLITFNPGLAGAGLLASSNSGRQTRWEDIDELEIIRSQNTIVLHSGLLVLDAIFCTPDNFQDVCRRIEAKVMYNNQ
nr:hypothetical protein [uncultured Cohaesibacter sp.]